MNFEVLRPSFFKHGTHTSLCTGLNRPVQPLKYDSCIQIAFPLPRLHEARGTSSSSMKKSPGANHPPPANNSNKCSMAAIIFPRTCTVDWPPRTPVYIEVCLFMRTFLLSCFTTLHCVFLHVFLPAPRLQCDLLTSTVFFFFFCVFITNFLLASRHVLFCL